MRIPSPSPTHFLASVAIGAALVLSVLPGQAQGVQPPAEQSVPCGQVGGAPCAVASARYVGPKPSACPDGTFFDSSEGGTCWRCPMGTVRQVTAADLSSACLRPPGEESRAASLGGRPGGLFGLECAQGEFYEADGNCYRCPEGFKRTIAAATEPNACTRWRDPSFSRAQQRLRLRCAAGTFFDPARGGSCWTCPPGYLRTAAPITAPDACSAHPSVASADRGELCDGGRINAAGFCVTEGD